MCVSGGVPKSATSRAREDGRSWAGQAVIVWRYAFDMDADVAAFAADSGSLLRVTGRRESAARYKSLSFEFSGATAQGPTLPVNKRGRLHTALNSRYGADACGGGVLGFVKQVMPPRYTPCMGKRSPLAVD